MCAKFLWGLLLLPLLVTTPLLSQDASAYVEVRKGELPIILTAPHGGVLKPGGIRNRSFGRVAMDANTAQITDSLAVSLKNRYGAAPHVIKCLLHRSKVDCNRDVDEAAQGDPVALATWRRFHAATEESRKEVLRLHGSGLLLDIHGHRHEIPRVELGYLLTGAQLALSDAAINGSPRLALSTSIRELDSRSPHSLPELLRGRQSLGGLLEKRGFRSVPSPTFPQPGKGEYFSGAYNVMAHGSRDEGAVSAIQIECPWEGVRDKPENQKRFVQALTEALGEYFKIHFGRDLSGNASGVSKAP